MQAGIVASQQYGVAKGAYIVSVKILDDQGLGTSDALVAGIDWILNDNRAPNSRKVINLSVSSPASNVINTAVYQAYLAGATVVVAAGNDDADACTKSPAGARGVLTVAAVNKYADMRWSSSNYGACVDIFAPGQYVTSLGHTTDTAKTVVRSGTSVAAPFVSGVAARVIASGVCGETVESNDCVYDSILTQATRKRITAKGTRSPNRLLYRSPALP